VEGNPNHPKELFGAEDYFYRCSGGKATEGACRLG
jgi:hypothetical protein